MIDFLNISQDPDTDPEEFIDYIDSCPEFFVTTIDFLNFLDNSDDYNDWIANERFLVVWIVSRESNIAFLECVYFYNS